MGTVLTGWYVGWAIAIVVISIVAILASAILVLARRIAKQAIQIELSLDEGRIRTLALWNVANVNDQINQIVKRAATASQVLESRAS